jgi:hypothetical protein
MSSVIKYTDLYQKVLTLGVHLRLGIPSVFLSEAFCNFFLLK